MSTALKTEYFSQTHGFGPHVECISNSVVSLADADLEAAFRVLAIDMGSRLAPPVIAINPEITSPYGMAPDVGALRSLSNAETVRLSVGDQPATIDRATR